MEASFRAREKTNHLIDRTLDSSVRTLKIETLSTLPTLFSPKRLALCTDTGRGRDICSTLSPIPIDRIKFVVKCTSYAYCTYEDSTNRCRVRARGSDWIHVRRTILLRAREEPRVSSQLKRLRETRHTRGPAARLRLPRGRTVMKITRKDQSFLSP